MTRDSVKILIENVIEIKTLLFFLLLCFFLPFCVQTLLKLIESRILYTLHLDFPSLCFIFFFFNFFLVYSFCFNLLNCQFLSAIQSTLIIKNVFFHFFVVVLFVASEHLLLTSTKWNREKNCKRKLIYFSLF